MLQHTPQEVINKQILKQKPTEDDYNRFLEALTALQESINPEQKEEHNKTFIKHFLDDAFYGKTNLVNTADNVDYAIYQTRLDSSPLEVLIEIKTPANTSEFPTLQNLNYKALQELVLYFMRERVKKSNIYLKHLIITNGYEWYLFDATDFEKLFFNDKKFTKDFIEFDNKTLLFSTTQDFYTQLAKPKIAAVQKELPFVFFDIRNLKSDRRKTNIYHLLSPAHLLKQFKFTDSNKLNSAFYNELLHIIGLEERKKDGKNVIERKQAGRRNEFSLLESTIYQLAEDIADKDKQFDIALNLVITWVNRILFLKLLESQLISYHSKRESDKYRFLSIDKIADYNDLNDLFFKVLAIPIADRAEQIKAKYQNIPYLNSSLFEYTDNENRYFKIRGLKKGDMPLYEHTVLKDVNGHRMKMQMDTLHYLFKFLDAYDFGSEQGEELTQQESKTLINASVLGLIFEKINGYKDGSFFTPGFITQYMCREAIERTVVQKFNEHYGWQCQTLQDIYNKNYDLEEAIAILNSITICDPAVGSGHFLVSALNTLIYIRAYLGLLYDENGKKIKGYTLSIDNDELIIQDEEGDIFRYRPKDIESQRIQKTLFCLKRQIIENNLFGADLNPNSVNICRLRLWIELLKNAYYKDGNELETLPNIDINIKCGDSLISKYPVKVGMSGGMNDNNRKKNIYAYKAAVLEYKQTNNKAKKQQITQQIEQIKKTLKQATPQLELFSNKREVDKISKLYEQVNPLEWMLEFPEILDEEGRFLGFDIVIGNPPFISPKGVDTDIKKLYEKIYHFADDTYNHFTFRGVQITKTNGILSLITPKTYWTIQTKRNMRDLLLSKKINFFFDAANPFDEVLVDTCIFQVQNTPRPENHQLQFYDGSLDLNNPIAFEPITQNTYINTQNSVIFKPTELNIKIWNIYGEKVKALYDQWWNKIKTSKDIEKNKAELEAYRASLRPGDVALLGCLTEGGQGLATANNGKYIAIRRSSKWAENVLKNRPEKLAEAVKQHPQITDEYLNGQSAQEFIQNSDEATIVQIFDAIKERYSRDIFGQGYIFRLIDDSEIADVDSLTDDEKENGIDITKPYYVPYDKGDKDGNRWYLETPFAIAWSKENVRFLKTDHKARYQGYSFFFKEGFRWSAINGTRSSNDLKFCYKQQSVNDVQGMSLCCVSNMVTPQYITAIGNADFISRYTEAFINSTVIFQINDCRQIPIIIPSEEQLEAFHQLFCKAIEIKMTSNDTTQLNNVQKQLDELTLQLYGIA